MPLAEKAVSIALTAVSDAALETSQEFDQQIVKGAESANPKSHLEYCPRLA
jgi:hypothetical protein